ncbi:VOC family protein [Flavobacterium sp. CBA20B-1]|uniref:VOC family protein n=1 Tax=unclassified Flavobacterium TaxID=196869 RepID=UPI002224CA03|nr:MULTISPECIES: VOC family protein [unclassified Flavobacterium]WCM43259.1 VOC family protein [Flavobacterium sp. CBA20B-1]
MARIHAYLNFNGNCEQAFSFYEKVFKTPNIGINRFGDMPENPEFPINDEDKQKIMHTAIMLNENTMIMGSDCLESFGHQLKHGNSTYVMLDTDTAQEAKDLYASLSENAMNIEMELSEQFWAELYASFQDQFGIWWMIHFEGNKKME